MFKLLKKIFSPEKEPEKENVKISELNNWLK